MTNQIANLSSPDLQILDRQLGKLKAQLDLIARAAAGGKSPGNGYHSDIAAKADTLKWVQIDLGQPAATGRSAVDSRAPG